MAIVAKTVSEAKVADRSPDGSPMPKQWRAMSPEKNSIVLRIGKENASGAAAKSEYASTLLGKIVKATKKPGIRREAVFPAGHSKQMYAYYVSAADLTKIVREDASGKKVVGLFVDGKFRPAKMKKSE